MKDFLNPVNWTLMRIVRVALGGYVVFESIRTGQYMLGIIGALVLVQGLMNFGCGCSVPQQRYQKPTFDKNTEVTYEEIK
jgi:hypothetical protein